MSLSDPVLGAPAAGGPAAPFLAALARHELLYQRCSNCGRAQHLARYACGACGSWELAWQRAAGEGTVHAVTLVNRAPSDAFLPLVPYTLILVTLDEGARFMAHAEPGIRIGDRVRVGFFEHSGRTLMRWGPSGSSPTEGAGHERPAPVPRTD